MGETVSLPELRTQLVQIRGQIAELVPKKNQYHQSAVKAKSAYKLALAKAKLRAMQNAKTKEERTPTMINAAAETDTEVIAAQQNLDVAECFEAAADLHMDALEEQCKAIKKAMGSIETEMRTFGG